MAREEARPSLSPLDRGVPEPAHTPDTLTMELNGMARETGRHAGAPFVNGILNVPLLREAVQGSKTVRGNYERVDVVGQERIITAAIQAHEMAIGEPVELMPTSFAETLPDIRGWRFLPGFLRLPSDALRLQALNNYVKTLDREEIEGLISGLAGLEVGEGRKYFAPFYTTGLETQLDVTTQIETLREEILRGDGIEILPPEERWIAIVTEESVRGKRMPMDLAVSLVEPEEGQEAEPNHDHDSGNCDSAFNEMNFKGERGVVLARREEFAFFITPDSYAWVPAETLAASTIPEEPAEPTTATPQDLLNHFVTTNDGLPYRWGIDCSSQISRSSRETDGPQLGKNSGEIGGRLEKAVGKRRIIENARNLNLREGLYYIDMGRMRGEGDGKTFGGSTHAWLCAVVRNEAGKLEYHAYSMAFQLKNGNGEWETPVSMHMTDRDALKRYVEKDHRALRAIPIAIPGKERQPDPRRSSEESLDQRPRSFQVITPEEVVTYTENLSRFGIVADIIPVYFLQPGDPLFDFREYGDKLFRKFPENTEERRNIRILYSANYLPIEMRLGIIGDMAKAVGIELDGTMPGFAQANTEGEISFYAIGENEIIPMARAYALKEGVELVPSTMEEAMAFLRGMAETTFYHEVGHTIHAQIPEDERAAWDTYTTSDQAIVQRIQFLQEDKYNDPDTVPVGAEAFAEIFVNIVDPQGRKGRLGENLDAEERMKALLARTNPNFHLPEE